MAAARKLVGEALRRVHGARLRRSASTRRCSIGTTSSSATPRCGRSIGPSRWREQTAAYRRLVFDEFLRMQVGLVARKRALAAEESGIRTRSTVRCVPALFLDQLPVRAHRRPARAIAEITRDMASAAPMHRLLQGDVGSGKTVVALAALLVAVQGGYQGAFMAPTEVLAEQHYLGSAKLLEGLDGSEREGSLLGDRPVRVELLTNRTTAAERRRIASGLADNEVDILVGTHALLYGDAEFTQPRLRRDRRAAPLRRRAARAARGQGAAPSRPDVLVMTATPIPRTAAMLVYGDLDKSELREMPPGRTPIATKVVGPSPLDQVAMWKRLRDEVEAGHQAYVVCPLVEDKGKIEAKAATAEFERLQAEELAGLRLGVAARAAAVEGEGGGDGRVPRRRARRARRDDRHRGRRRRRRTRPS